MPTPLDFPNAPTVGQQYAAPTGVLYAWDGAVWTAGAATTGLPPTGAAGGDLAGTYPNPTIGPGAVGNAEISDVAYGKVTGAPSIPTTLPPSGAASGDLTGTYPGPTIGTLKVTDAKVNDVAWGKITGAPTAFPPSGTAGGDLSGTYPNPQILATGVTAGTYGTTAKIPQVTLTAEGRISAVTELTVAPTGGSPTGAAGGSLAGSYPNPTVAASAIRGTPSSGGTAREIAKVSIWGGDDLIDASVTDAKIAGVAYSKVTGSPLTVQARVTSTTPQSLASSTWTAVLVDTVAANVGGVYAAGAPDRFTIATTGFYLFGGGFQFVDAVLGGGTRQLALGGPGLAVVYALLTTKPTLNGGLASAAGAALTAGTVVQLFAYQDAPAALNISQYNPTHFWIARVA